MGILWKTGVGGSGLDHCSRKGDTGLYVCVRVSVKPTSKHRHTHTPLSSMAMKTVRTTTTTTLLSW